MSLTRCLQDDHFADAIKGNRIAPSDQSTDSVYLLLANHDRKWLVVSGTGMARRKHHLLTEACDQVLAMPTGRDDFERLYTFEPSDIDIIGAAAWAWRCCDIPARRLRR